MPENRKLKVFLCHSKDDKPKVRELYRRLVADGFDAWLDEEKLMPGQDWDLEIRKAVRESNVVVVCLSKDSVTKAGYVQKEIRFALDVADEQPEGAVFIIPARLEDCQVPTRLSKWQWVNLFEETGYERLIKTLTEYAAQPENSQTQMPKINKETKKEKRQEQLKPRTRSQSKKLISQPFIQVTFPKQIETKPKVVSTISRGHLRLLLILLLLTILYELALINYVFPKITGTVNVPPNVGINYKAPKYLSVGDENNIDVTVVNLDTKEPPNGIITLTFSDPTIPLIVTSSQGMSIIITDLPPGGRITKALQFKLTSKSGLENVEYYFQYSGPDKTQSVSNKNKFLIAPIDFLRSNYTWVFITIGGTGFFWLLMNLLGEQFKRFLGTD